MQQLRVLLTRQHLSACYDEVIQAASSSPSSKLGVLAARLQHPVPPVHLTLGGVAIPSHRAALASFLCTDWFLCKFARNYYAKRLLPRTPAHLERLQEIGIDANYVCMCCWHFCRDPVLEDEFHAVCTCPQYHGARQELLRALPADSTLNTSSDLFALLSSAVSLSVVDKRVENAWSISNTLATSSTQGRLASEAQALVSRWRAVHGTTSRWMQIHGHHHLGGGLAAC